MAGKVEQPLTNSVTLITGISATENQLEFDLCKQETPTTLHSIDAIMANVVVKLCHVGETEIPVVILPWKNPGVTQEMQHDVVEVAGSVTDEQEVDDDDEVQFIGFGVANQERTMVTAGGGWNADSHASKLSTLKRTFDDIKEHDSSIITQRRRLEPLPQSSRITTLTMPQTTSNPTASSDRMSGLDPPLAVTTPKTPSRMAPPEGALMPDQSPAVGTPRSDRVLGPDPSLVVTTPRTPTPTAPSSPLTILSTPSPVTMPSPIPPSPGAIEGTPVPTGVGKVAKKSMKFEFVYL